MESPAFFQRRVRLIGLTSLFLLAACSAPAAMPSPSQATPEAVIVPTAVAALVTALPATAAAWTTYTEPGLGYSLSFPQDVEFSSGTSKAGVHTARLQFRVPGADGYQGMVLRVEPNPEGRDIEQVAQELYRRNWLEEPPADWLQQQDDVSIAGLSGVQLNWGHDFSLVVPYADHVYIIAPVHDTATTAISPEALALFYQVLATLKVAR